MHNIMTSWALNNVPYKSKTKQLWQGTWKRKKTLAFLSVSQETNNELVGNKQLTILGYRYLAAVGTVPTLLCPILPYRFYSVLKNRRNAEDSGLLRLLFSHFPVIEIENKTNILYHEIRIKWTGCKCFKRPIRRHQCYGSWSKIRGQTDSKFDFIFL